MIISSKTTLYYVIHSILCTLLHKYIHSILYMSFCIYVSSVYMSLLCVYPSVGMFFHAICMTLPCMCRFHVYVSLYICFLRHISPPCLWSHWVYYILCYVYTWPCVHYSVCIYVLPYLCSTVCIFHDIYTKPGIQNFTLVTWYLILKWIDYKKSVWERQ